MIDIDSMYAEMLSTMYNNFNGSPTERFAYARGMFLIDVAAAIDQNKDGLIQEVTDKETYQK